MVQAAAGEAQGSSKWALHHCVAWHLYGCRRWCPNSCSFSLISCRWDSGRYSQPPRQCNSDHLLHNFGFSFWASVHGHTPCVIFIRTHNTGVAEVGLLVNLQVVKLMYFRGDRLPDMSKLTSLRTLTLEHSDSLECINLQNLPRLSGLYIYGCVACGAWIFPSAGSWKT